MSLPKAVVDKLNQGPLGTLLKGIGAGTVGAADELAFGALSQGWLGKYVADTTKRIQEENPMTTTAGAVASNFVPVLGLANKGAKAFKIGRKALSAGNHALKAYQNSSVAKLLSKIPQSKLAGLMEENPYFIGSMSRMMGSAAKGAGQSVASGEATHALRRLTGASQAGTESQDADRIASEITFGAGAGLLGKILRAAAPAVYTHPALIDSYDLPGSRKRAKALMEEGIHGNMNTFDEVAKGLKSQSEQVLKNTQSALENADTQAVRRMNAFNLAQPSSLAGPQNIQGSIPIRAFNRFSKNRAGKFAPRDSRISSSLENLNEIERKLVVGSPGHQKFSHKIYGMKPKEFTNPEQIERALQEVNEDLLAQKRAVIEAARGGVGAGNAPIEIRELQQRKDVLEELHNYALRSVGDATGTIRITPEQISEFRKAKQVYGQGKGLEQSLHLYDVATSGPRPPSAPFHFADAFRNAAAKSVANLPIRTGLGVLLNKSTERNLGHLAGRRQERVSRREIDDTAPYLSGFDRIMERLGEPSEAEEPADDQAWMKPPSEEARKESGKKFGFDDDVLAVIKDPAGVAPEVRARAESQLDKVRDASLKKRKKEVLEEPEEDFDYEKAFDEIGRE